MHIVRWHPSSLRQYYTTWLKDLIPVFFEWDVVLQGFVHNLLVVQYSKVKGVCNSSDLQSMSRCLFLNKGRTIKC